MKNTTLKLNQIQNDTLINILQNRLGNYTFEWIEQREFNYIVYESTICIKLLQKFNSRKFAYMEKSVKNMQVDFAELTTLREILKYERIFLFLDLVKQIDNNFVQISQKLKYSNSEPDYVKYL